MNKKSFGSNQRPAVNKAIMAKSVRVITDNGEMLGVLAIDVALKEASDRGLDLVEVSPKATPPVCKIIDYGKYKYRVQKKQAEARKKQKTFEVKEVKLRPGIEDHDYGVKLKSIQRFLSDGDKVKITLRFKGREMTYQKRGFDILKKLESAIEQVAKIEQVPTLEGKHMIMVVAPR